MLKFSLLALLFIPFLLRATWFEVTAVSTLGSNGNIARKSALENAIFEALKFADADIATLESIRAYLTEPKDNYFFSGNEIKEIQIIKQEKTKSSLKLTARINIAPVHQACYKKLYRKKMLLSKFRLLNPKHAMLGSIFQFGTSFTKLLQKQMAKEAQSFVVQGITPFAVSLKQPQALRMIAKEADAQYILLGDITDMTATLNKNNKNSPSNRQLAMNIWVVDELSGDIIFQNNYRNIAQWTFDLSSKLDTETARFWTSAYGQMALNMGRDILLDLESSLSCRMTKPKIIAINKNRGQISAGRSQGVKLGDQLALWHNSAFIDKLGIAREQLRQSAIRLTIIRVYENSADIEISPASLAASIQIGDLTSKLVN